MARIKITDLPKHMEIDKEDLENIRGGIDTVPVPERPSSIFIGTWPTPDMPSYLSSKIQRSYSIETVPLPE